MIIFSSNEINNFMQLSYFLFSIEFFFFKFTKKRDNGVFNHPAAFVKYFLGGSSYTRTLKFIFFAIHNTCKGSYREFLINLDISPPEYIKIINSDTYLVSL